MTSHAHHAPPTTTHHHPSFIQLFIILSKPSHHHIDHEDPPSPLFRRLYLGVQPRYKPSAASSLSPTPKASTDALQSPPAISVPSSANRFLPRHETNFFVPPPHRFKPSLESPSSLCPSTLSNNSTKRSQRLGARNVSICL